MSKLYFTYSAMNAGKSAILLQAAYNYRERGMAVMLWTSGHYGADQDARLGMIESRIGLEADAHLYRADTDLFEAIEREHAANPLSVIFFDEAQFLTKDQVWQLATSSNFRFFVMDCELISKASCSKGLQHSWRLRTIYEKPARSAIAERKRP